MDPRPLDRLLEPAGAARLDRGRQWVPPEGRDFVFSNRVDGQSQVFVQPVDRNAAPERLWPSERAHLWLDVSADGRQVILITFDGAGDGVGFFVLDRRSGEVRTVIEEGAVYSAAFHPDGNRIVYARSDAKGSNLWLAPFPGPGEPRQVTFEGGEEPRWSLAADEIYYRGPTYVMAIPVETSGGALVTGKPRALFEDRFRHSPSRRGFQNYWPHPNGRLLMIERAQGDEESLVLVQNWRAKVAKAFAPSGDG